MIRRSLVPVVLITAVLALACAAPARAQTPVPTALHDGYSLLFNGDKPGAAKYFDDQLKAHPDDLSLRYGWLVAQRTQLGDAALRPAFEKALDAFVTAAEKRHGKDDDALFYLAQAHLLRGEYKFSFDKGMFGAARDGADARSYALDYIKKHPDNPDGYFVIGMYNYYVDIVPTFVKVLKFFLFLPGGDRVNGLKQIERAAGAASPLAPLAQSMLVEIYSSYEARGADAAATAEKMLQQFPANDEVAFRFAGICAGPLLEDRARAAGVYQHLMDRHKADKTREGLGANYNGLLGLAGLKRDAWRIDEAIAMLNPVIDAKITTPEWVLATFVLRRANYKMALNDAGATDDARRVQNDLAMTPWKDNATQMLAEIDRRKASGEATTIAALVPGNRLMAEGKYDEAEKAYAPLVARDPKNAFIRYRVALLDFQRGKNDVALGEFNALAASLKGTAPDAIVAQAWLHVGRLQDLAGRRAEAKRAYQKVIDDYAKQPGAVSAAKIGLITVYRRPATAVASR